MSVAKRHLILLVAVAALLQLLPAYPAETNEYYGWFGPPGHNSRYVNGTTFHSFAEVLGGGFDWTTTSGGCVTDSGGWTRYRANPLLLLAYALSVASLWLALGWVLGSSRTERTRRRCLSVLAGISLIASGAWLGWYGLLAVTCPADIGLSHMIAVALTVLCLAVAIALAASRNALARGLWPPVRSRPRERP